MDLAKLKELIEDLDIKGDKISIKRDLYKTVEYIKTYFHFDMLKNITAIDNIEKGIELVYCFYSTTDDEDVLLSISTQDYVESISELYDSAVADEKEIYDLFGVNFDGNKELSRLYLPEGWQGHPLRKDYVENDERLRWND